VAMARSTKAAVYLRIYTELCRVAKLNASASTYSLDFRGRDGVTYDLYLIEELLQRAHMLEPCSLPSGLDC